MANPLLDALFVCGLIGFAVALYLLVRVTRRRNVNTQLWGTLFESISHYVQPQEQLKAPKQQIEKQKRQAGDDLE
jgi:hypothetical protein